MYRLLVLSSCHGNDLILDPPFYGSHPYFLDCGSSLVEAVRHMHPNRTRHESFADVEPVR